jgi:hypothetical protein
LIDAVSGQPVQTSELKWHAALPDEVLSSGVEHAQFDELAGSYFIRAPAVVITLEVTDWNYLPIRQDVDLTNQFGPVLLELTPAFFFRVRLMDGETEVAIPDSWGAFPIPVEGTVGQAGLSSGDKFGRRFQVSEPGVYTLDLLTPPGYEALTPLRIELTTRDHRTIEVPLVRKVQ